MLLMLALPWHTSPQQHCAMCFVSPGLTWNRCPFLSCVYQRPSLCVFSILRIGGVQIRAQINVMLQINPPRGSLSDCPQHSPQELRLLRCFSVDFCVFWSRAGPGEGSPMDGAVLRDPEAMQQPEPRALLLPSLSSQPPHNFSSELLITGGRFPLISPPRITPAPK